MIKAKHTVFHSRFFLFYSNFHLKRKFKNIFISADTPFSDKSIMLIGNHFSWWDGFIVYFVNHRVFHKKFYVMMLEDQLKTRLFLRNAGAFSINPGMRNAADSIHYAQDILAEEGNTLVLFPQGEIQSHHVNPVKFQKGWIKILEPKELNVQLVFMVNLVDYFSEKKPSLYIYLKSIDVTYPIDVLKLEEGYNIFMQQCIQNQKEG